MPAKTAFVSELAINAEKPANFSYKQNGVGPCLATWTLFVIREAWGGGCDFEDLADGYGLGMGTHDDWSGIRDSSPEAKLAMTERALNFIVERLAFATEAEGRLKCLRSSYETLRADVVRAKERIVELGGDPRLAPPKRVRRARRTA